MAVIAEDGVALPTLNKVGGHYSSEVREQLKAHVRELEASGMSRTKIQQQTGISLKTIKKWIGCSPLAEKYATKPDKLKIAKEMVAEGVPYLRITRSTGLSSQTLERHFGPSPIDNGIEYAQEARKRLARERYEEMVRLRMKEGLRNEQIAERMGMSHARIYGLLGPTPRRLGGHPTHPVGWRDRARYLQDVGYEPVEIARQMNLPRQTVWEWLNGRH